MRRILVLAVSGGMQFGCSTSSPSNRDSAACEACSPRDVDSGVDTSFDRPLGDGSDAPNDEHADIPPNFGIDVTADGTTDEPSDAVSDATLVPTTTSASIGTAGGSLRSGDDEITVTVPTGALDHEVLLTINGPLPEVGTSDGRAYDIGPSGTRFARTVTIAVRSHSAIDPSDALVFKGTDGQWHNVDLSDVDVDAGVIVGLTSHLTLYGIRANPRSATDCTCDGSIIQKCCNQQVGTFSGAPGTCACTSSPNTNAASFDWGLRDCELANGAHEVGGCPDCFAKCCRNTGGYISYESAVDHTCSCAGGSSDLMACYRSESCQDKPAPTNPNASACYSCGLAPRSFDSSSKFTSYSVLIPSTATDGGALIARPYYLRLPVNYDPNNKLYPVVFVAEDCYGSGPQAVPNSVPTDAIVVQLVPVSFSCWAFDVTPNNPELAYVKSVVAEVGAHYCEDQHQLSFVAAGPSAAKLGSLVQCFDPKPFVSIATSPDLPCSSTSP